MESGLTTQKPLCLITRSFIIYVIVFLSQFNSISFAKGFTYTEIFSKTYSDRQLGLRGPFKENEKHQLSAKIAAKIKIRQWMDFDFDVLRFDIVDLEVTQSLVAAEPHGTDLYSVAKQSTRPGAIQMSIASRKKTFQAYGPQNRRLLLEDNCWELIHKNPLASKTVSFRCVVAPIQSPALDQPTTTSRALNDNYAGFLDIDLILKDPSSAYTNHSVNPGVAPKMFVRLSVPEAEDFLRLDYNKTPRQISSTRGSWTRYQALGNATGSILRFSDQCTEVQNFATSHLGVSSVTFVKNILDPKLRYNRNGKVLFNGDNWATWFYHYRDTHSNTNRFKKYYYNHISAYQRSHQGRLPFFDFSEFMKCVVNRDDPGVINGEDDLKKIKAGFERITRHGVQLLDEFNNVVSPETPPSRVIKNIARLKPKNKFYKITVSWDPGEEYLLEQVPH